MLTWSLHGSHVDVRATALASLDTLELLLQPLQLEDEGALLGAQGLQHCLFLDQCLSQLVQAPLQLRLTTATQSLVGQLDRGVYM